MSTTTSLAPKVRVDDERQLEQATRGAEIDAVSSRMAAISQAAELSAATGGDGSDAAGIAGQSSSQQAEELRGLLGRQTVQRLAATGLSGAGSAYPNRARIEEALGHELGPVQAAIDPQASASCERLGANAYTLGDRVAFSSPPSLRTAAHEAVHVIQQRHGVRPSSGVGSAGDSHERQAEAVAERVVQGKSARGLIGGLKGMSAKGPGGSRGAASVVSPALQFDNTTTVKKGKEKGEHRDPEQKDGVLPFYFHDGKTKWFTKEVMANLSQIDNSPSTIADDNKCVSASHLVIYITAGPAAVSGVAKDTATRMSNLVANRPMKMAKNVYTAMKTHQTAVAGLPDKINRRKASYADLRLLVDWMHLTSVYKDTKGAGSKEEYAEVGALGGGQVKSLTGKTGTGWSAFKPFSDQLDRSFAKNVGFIVSVSWNKTTNHACTLGLDHNAEMYFFDPWPKKGSQTMRFDKDQAAIAAYFNEGPWEIKQQVQAPRT